MRERGDRRGRTRRVRALACALALWLPAGAQETACVVWSPLPEPALRAALEPLGVGRIDVVGVADDALAERLSECAEPRRPQLLVGQDALVLQRLEARGLLAAAAELAWRDPYVLVAGPRQPADARLPSTLEEIVFDGDLHHEYVLPRAEASAPLWAGLVEQELRKGRDEEYAFAWLRTLEAHALEEAASEADALDAVRAGRARLTIVSRSGLLAALRAAGAAELRQVSAIALPQRGRGVATVRGAPPCERLEPLVAALRGARVREAVAEAASLIALPAAGAESRDASASPLAAFEGGLAREPEASRWIARWIGKERGRGRTALSVENVLDVAFCAVFVVFLVYAYRRLGRGEATEHGAS